MPYLRFIAALSLTPIPFAFLSPAKAADNPPPLFELDGAAHFDAIHAALQADRPDEAYVHARAWARREPQATGPQAALARAYLGLRSPAAALEAVDRALRLAPSGNEARSLRMLKIQAHAEIGEMAAAWANTRALLRKTRTPDDPFADLLNEMQWHFFAALFEPAHLANFEERLGGSKFTERDPLTPERIARDSAALHEAFARRLADLTEDRDAVFAELMRFAILHQHHGPWYDRDGPGLPFIEYSELQDAFSEYAAGRELPVYGRWLRDHLPQEFDAESSPATTPAPAGDLATDLGRFLRTIDPVWQRLRARLEAAIADADVARSTAEIEAAWDALERLVKGPIDNVLREIAGLALRLETESDPVPAGVRETFARWRSLPEDPLLADARFRVSHPAAPFLVVTEEAYGRPDELARPLSVYVTETQATRSLFARWVNAVLADEAARLGAPVEALEAADAPALAAFDVVIARDLMTPTLWEKRLRAAEAVGDWTEFVWSAYQVHHDNPRALARLLGPRLADLDARVTAARERLRQPESPDHVEAFATLLDVLDRDPAHADALVTLFETLLASGRDEAALDAYIRLWQLDLPGSQADSEVLALAVRLGAWPFLLEIADRRVLANDGDSEAHFHRQLAAAALGLAAVAADSTPALTGTPYHPRSAVLESIALGMQGITFDHYRRKDTGLKAVEDLLGGADEDPAVRPWLGLVYQQRAQQLRIREPQWQALEKNASLTTISHLNFLRGTLPAAAYRDTHRNTPEEQVARFLEYYLAHSAQPTPESRARLAELTADSALPLLLRVAAHTPEARATAEPIYPFRRSSRLHVDPHLKDWAPVWSGMAPGQTVVSGGAVPLATVPGRTTLRLTAFTNNPIVSPALAKTTGRLWELEGIIVNGPAGVFRKPALEIPAGGVLAVSDSAITANAVAGTGRIWLEDTDWHHATIEGTGLHLHNVIANNTDFSAATRFEAQRLIAHGTGLTLGASDQPNPASGHLHDSYLHVIRNPGFAGAPTNPLQVVRSTLSVLRDDFDKLSLSARESRLFALTPMPGAPAEFTTTVLNRFGEPTHRVTNTQELLAALGRAQPGDQVLLAAGDYPLRATLRLPEGVSLRGERGSIIGRNAARIVVQGGTRIDPLIAIEKGAVSIAHLDFDVLTGTVEVGGRTFNSGDHHPNRRGIVAGPGTTLLVSDVVMNAWQFGVATRPAIVADNADVFVSHPVPHSVAVTNRGRLIATARPEQMTLAISGTGDVYAPFAADRQLLLAGAGLRFHGRELDHRKIDYQDGAASHRGQIWQAAAREHLWATLEIAAPELIANLDAERDTARRMQLVRDFGDRLGHLFRTAAPPPEEIARNLTRLLNPGFLRHRNDLPFLFEALHVNSRGLPDGVMMPHLATFSAADQARIRANATAIVRPNRAGQTPEARLGERVSYMKSYPPGHYVHGRAMEALARGEPFSEFQGRIRAEEARRAAAIRQAEARRKDEEANRAVAKAIEDYTRRRQSEMARQSVAQAGSWSNRSAGGWSSSSSSYRPYQPSASRQLQDYRRQLDTQIHNVGRGYGQGRRY